ncbi:MAG: hypothetical protein JF590_00465 [Gemmatimonadetes bacterium]|nr:hypothetical protein [Gemmatimonadota bacterium]
MRGLILILLGLALVVVGALILSGDITTTTHAQSIDLGVIKATARATEPLPKWTGFAAIGAGVVLLLAGARRRG